MLESLTRASKKYEPKEPVDPVKSTTSGFLAMLEAEMPWGRNIQGITFEYIIHLCDSV